MFMFILGHIYSAVFAYFNICTFFVCSCMYFRLCISRNINNNNCRKFVSRMLNINSNPFPYTYNLLTVHNK